MRTVSRIILSLGLVVMLAMVLAACAPTAVAPARRQVVTQTPPSKQRPPLRRRRV
ncbi:MAG: hypothetical protein IPK16_24580 [Anaerolineales bacterium]|nr:hypothetical protein [Anaerolineales bacterium]